MRIGGRDEVVMAYGKSGVLADVRERLGHGGDVYGLGAVPV